MTKVRFVTVKIQESFYVGASAELEALIGRGYEIVTSCAIRSDTILFTLVRR
jgi:hypothetical protein